MAVTARARAQVPPVPAKNGMTPSADSTVTLTATGLAAGAGNVIMQGTATTTPAVYGDLSNATNFPDSEVDELAFKLNGSTFDVSMTFTAGTSGASVGDHLYFAIHDGPTTVDAGTALSAVAPPITVVT